MQTPREPLYEGVTRLPEARDDFDYGLLEQAVGDLSAAIAIGGARTASSCCRGR